MENKYFMGVDPYGYDGVTGTCCVIEKGESNMKLVAEYRSRNKEDFDKEVERLVGLYKPTKIIKSEK